MASACRLFQVRRKRSNLVDVTSSSLNFLAEFVRKMKPIYDAILNLNNEVEESVRESHSVSPEIPILPQPTRTETHDAVSHCLDQRTSDLTGPLAVDQNDSAFSNAGATDRSGLTVVKRAYQSTNRRRVAMARRQSLLPCLHTMIGKNSTERHGRSHCTNWPRISECRAMQSQGYTGSFISRFPEDPIGEGLHG